MKAIERNNSKSVHETTVIALKRHASGGTVVQAAAALRHLSEQYRIKKQKACKTGTA
ncbi:MAG TPA: hypothetical protein VL197_17415 [Nitrospirota bacterium]|nr:hypothetical protein [Nitrospirota bacterium]